MDAQGLGKSLLEALEKVPDPQSNHGLRHPLSAILALLVCAMTSGARGLCAIAQWGRLQDPDALGTLGFTGDRTPAVSTLHKVFRSLDRDAFESVLGEWVESQLGTGGEAIAKDGKALRGIHGDEGIPGVRLVAAYTHGQGLVVGQRGVLGRVSQSWAWQVHCWIRSNDGQGAHRRRTVLPETVVRADGL